MDKSDYKVCTECGQEKHVSEFSKSYPHRLSQNIREWSGSVPNKNKTVLKKTENRTEMQKVVIKDTGETVLVRPCREPLNARLAFYETEVGRKFPMFALEFSKGIDWEQRRFEIAKDILAATYDFPMDGKSYAKVAVGVADALIAELKKGGQNV